MFKEKLKEQIEDKLDRNSEYYLIRISCQV